MNTIGIIALVVFSAAWFGGLFSWFAMIYHLFMFRLQHVRAKPTRHGFKTVRAAAVLSGFLLVGMGAGAIGAWVGNWQAGWPYGVHVFFA